ncbi:MAG: protein kinase [Polyangiaceae bacterium]
MEVGKILGGRFEIAAEVAKGGGGTIFRALDLGTGSFVAVKVLRGIGRREEARFGRETRILARLSHPGLVRYIAHGKDNEVPYLVTEWLEGEDLRARLGRKEMSVSSVVAMAGRVAATLGYLHALGVVHRDLKPSNVFLVGRRPDQAKVLDLGLVRATEDTGLTLTNTGMVVGTPGYIAPEQARGDRDLDPRTDVFSLGCVLYRCLAGKVAFGGANVLEMMSNLLVQEPPLLARVRPDLPAELSQLVHRMLQKDADRRPASGQEVAAALAALDLTETNQGPDSIPPTDKLPTLTGEERRLDMMASVSFDDARERSERPLLGKTVPFVGRDWELGTILGVFQGAVDGPSARAVLVTGPAGAGKTRLGREVERVIRESHPDVEVWRAVCVARAAGSPFGVMTSLLRSALNLKQDLAGPDAEARLFAAVARRLPGEEAALTAEVLADVIGIPLAAPSPVLRAARDNPRIFAERLRAAWHALVSAATAEHPLVTFLEDLQWGDGSTIRLVGDLLGALPERPWLVIALARPEIDAAQPRLWQERDCQHLRLRPLHKRAAEQIVRRALGDEADAATVSRVVAQADGNAFFLEELIRAQAEGADDSPPGALPDTVLATVHARLSQLDPEARRLLRAASVLGDVFWLSAAAELLGPDAAGTAGMWVDTLVAQEILVRHGRGRFPGEVQLAFRHGLLREGAYAMLTEADRALGHRLAGEWLERMGETDPLVLAKHFDEGGASEIAAKHYRNAARRAIAAMELDTAIALAGRARALSPAELQDGTALLLAEAHLWRSDVDEAHRLARDVYERSRPGSDTWMRASEVLLSVSFARGDLIGLMECTLGLTTVELDDDAGPAAVRVLALTTFFWALGGLGIGARRLLTRLTAVVSALPERHLMPLGYAAVAQAAVAAMVDGDPWTATQHLKTACALADEAGDTPNTWYFHGMLGLQYVELGMLEAAEQALARMGPADETESLIALMRRDLSVYLRMARGHDAEVRAAVAAYLGKEKKAGLLDALRDGRAHRLLGEMAERAGDLETAERELRAACETLRSTPWMWNPSVAALARVQVARGRPGEAIATIRSALSPLEAQDMHGPGEVALRAALAEARFASREHDLGKDEIRRAKQLLFTVAERIPDAEIRASFLGRNDHARLLQLAEQTGAV